jgi:hypothetical protein
MQVRRLTVLSSVDASIDPIKPEEDIKSGDKKDGPPEEDDKKSLPDETSDTATQQQQNTTTTQPTQTNALDMDLDDGELSDVSSASTIPLDEDDREDYRKPASQNPPSNEKSQQDAAPSEKDEDPVKPTKVKVSVQEYLKSRRAANQESPEITNPIP